MTSGACPAPSSGLAEAPTDKGIFQDIGSSESDDLGTDLNLALPLIVCVSLGNLASDLSVFWTKCNACQRAIRQKKW